MGVPPEKSKIADIAFAFNNRLMLSLLIKRQDKLSKAKFESATKIEDEITQMKNDHYEDLIIPNQFYCTFQEGAAQHKALDAGKFKIG